MNRLRRLIASAGRNTWNNWPARAYERDSYRHRLAAVEQHVCDALDCAPAGEIRVVSICAGDGRDLIDVVATHPRRGDVSAWLVEADRNSVEAGIASAKAIGLQDSFCFLRTDATKYETYQNIPRADILLLCGVWGHVPAEERDAVARACGALSRQGGSVIWTRGVRLGMERLDEISAHFRAPQWKQKSLTITSDRKWAVVTQSQMMTAASPPKDSRIFHFQTAAG
jgi:hypothetical protein